MRAMILITFCVMSFSCQKITPSKTSGNSDSTYTSGLEAAALKADNLCSEKDNTNETHLLKALRLINILVYNHTNQKPTPSGSPPPPPPGGTHPYEWDSLRTVEQMLTDRDGGSCGTHGLSIGAVARRLGIAESDIFILGGVLVPDYRDICPIGRKPRVAQFPSSNQTTTDIHPANGHIFLLAKLANGWNLINSTHNPDQKAGRARQNEQAACDYPFSVFEKVAFNSPEEIRNSFTQDLPLQIPVDSFPSLVEGLQQSLGQVPAMLTFSLWSVEDYPKHTIKDRMDMVASGNMGDQICRWELPTK